MLKRVFLFSFGLLLPQLVRSEEGLSVYNEPYEWKPMMPRCDHLTMIYDNLEFDHDKMKSQYPNSFTTSHNAYLSLFAWCREYAVKRNQPVSKEWGKWWNATEGVTDFDRFYMDGLEELVTDGDPGLKGDIDQVFDLVTLTAQVNAQPINVFIWKVILSLYQERPADLKLRNFIASNYADLHINIPDDVITDYWLEKVITEVILPAELKRNKERKLTPVVSIPNWEDWGQSKYSIIQRLSKLMWHDNLDHRGDWNPVSEDHTHNVKFGVYENPRHDEL